jgi:hypothetical protein
MDAKAARKKNESEQSPELEQKVQKLRELYADASDVSKAALENVIEGLHSRPSVPHSSTEAKSAGRIGVRQGKVSEFTTIFPLRPGGAKRMRAFFDTLHRSIGNEAVDKVGTVHDMRWVFLDNDTKVLFASAYDGGWDPYVDDFATKIPDIIDLQFGEIEGWPGVRHPSVKDFIVKHQVQAHFWYVASPDLSVVEAWRLERVGKAVDEFLDKVGE